MKFQQLSEYKTQTQISQYKTSNQIHPQQPPKIQIKKKKNQKPIRSERERIWGPKIQKKKNPKTHQIQVMQPRSRSLGRAT